MNRISIFLAFSIIGLLSAGSLMAQPINQATPEKMLEIAQAKLEMKDYYNALEWFEKYQEENETLEVAFQIAMLEYQLRDYSDAERSFRSIVRRIDRLKERKKRKPSTEVPTLPDIRFYYARTLKMNERYEDAIPEFETYMNDEAEDPVMFRRAKTELAGCRMALAMEMPADVTVSNLEDLNTEFADASPAITPDGQNMYYATFDRDDIITLDDDAAGSDDSGSGSGSGRSSSGSGGSNTGGADEGGGGSLFIRIHEAGKNEEVWEKGQVLDQKINREDFHCANPAFSEDGNIMFFTRASLSGNEVERSAIYFTKKADGGWGPANEVQGVNGDYVATHPMPGELYGRDVLFFVSDMDGGYGGYDIYYATLEGEGVYRNPVNLGDVINSSGDEATPFYIDGRLYFSSSGHPGIGGFDIFEAIWDGTTWSKPRNMGKVINSSVDDLYFNTDLEGYSGFLVSNRPGGKSVRSKTCCDDIWSYQKKRIDADLVVSVFVAENEPLLGASVQLVTIVDDAYENPKSKSGEKTHNFQYELELDAAYAVVVSADGFLPDTAAFNTVGLTESKTFELPFILMPEVVYDTITVTRNEPIRLNNIYYDFNDDKILPDAEKDLTVLIGLLEEYPELVIELSSHTDARGDDAYNERLSQRRANSARAWMLAQGVASNRIVAKGYGESQILNQCKNGVECTDDEHRYNRRTEFKILEGPTSIQIKQEKVQKKVRGEVIEEMDSGSANGSEGSGTLAGKGAILQFEVKNHDFGTVKRGQKPSFAFKFTNAGDEPLEFDMVSGCECTQIDWPEGKAFGPGESGEITIVYLSDKEEESPGRLEKSIDLILKNEDPKRGIPIFDELNYSLTLVE